MATKTNPKTVLITGANRGIGLELARQMAALDWQVVATSRRQLPPDSQLAQLEVQNANLSVYELDISDAESITQLGATINNQELTIDTLINNAGMLLDWHDSILDIDPQVIQDTFTTNTLGPVLVTRALLPALKRSHTPLVVNVSSAAGCLDEMRDWAPAYSISKTALNAVTRQFAAALEPSGIATCCISPGWVRTDMGGPNATRSVEDAAQSIVQLLAQKPDTLNGRFLRDTEDIPW